MVVGVRDRSPTPHFCFLMSHQAVGRAGGLGCKENLEIDELGPAGWWEGGERDWQHQDSLNRPSPNPVTMPQEWEGGGTERGPGSGEKTENLVFPGGASR